MKWLPRIAALAPLLAAAAAAPALASGTLVPVGSGQDPARIIDHDVRVVINNGFARTEVTQTFFNPNHSELEAIYTCPVPESASLSEMTIWAGENKMTGEVVTREQADRIYERERSLGNDVGKAEKNGYQTFDFFVAPVPPRSETRVQFVYYQPVALDGAVGRYVYPMQDGGTDDGKSFWDAEDKVERSFRFEVELKSAVPVEQVRVPDFEGAAQVQQLHPGHYITTIDQKGGRLNKDVVFYYRLPVDTPGQVELMTYKPNPNEPGTFMLVVTPGIDLQPLTNGSDYVFVLDVSGSMHEKLDTLLDGVARALQRLERKDRFRVITFNDRAREVTHGWQWSTRETVDACIAALRQQGAGGSTNMFQGIHKGLGALDADRATNLVLVTDAVTNTGVVEPSRFARLVETHDVRIFGFLLGNNGNWPLLRMMCEASGGFWQRVSNADDIYGQVVLAQDKLTHECLHHATVEIEGVDAFDTTDLRLGKVYRGQQVRIFGRYRSGGEAHVRLRARVTGEDRVYETRFAFPDVSADDPEIERLWAMEWIESIETQRQTGRMEQGEAQHAIRDLGVQFQLVTDETSMVVLPDEAFASYGIERRNVTRTAVEQAAQQQRQVKDTQTRKPRAPRSRRVDNQKPMFQRSIPSPGGGGAISPIGLGLLLIPLAAQARRRFV